MLVASYASLQIYQILFVTFMPTSLDTDLGSTYFVIECGADYAQGMPSVAKIFVMFYSPPPHTHTHPFPCILSNEKV